MVSATIIGFVVLMLFVTVIAVGLSLFGHRQDHREEDPDVDQ